MKLIEPQQPWGSDREKQVSTAGWTWVPSGFRSSSLPGFSHFIQITSAREGLPPGNELTVVKY